MSTWNTSSIRGGRAGHLTLRVREGRELPILCFVSATNEKELVVPVIVKKKYIYFYYLSLKEIIEVKIL